MLEQSDRRGLHYSHNYNKITFIVVTTVLDNPMDDSSYDLQFGGFGQIIIREFIWGMQILCENR